MKTTTESSIQKEKQRLLEEIARTEREIRQQLEILRRIGPMRREKRLKK